MTTTTTENRLTAIETKVDTVEKVLERQIQALEELTKALHQMTVRAEALKDHETRIRALELQAMKLTGIAVAVSFLAPYLPKVLQAISGA